MGRFVKNIINKDGIDVREVGYYSTPRFIAEYITKELLSINPDGKYVLDPAVGKEELLEYFHIAGKQIDSFDIIDYENKTLSKFIHKDFISYYIGSKKELICSQSFNWKYDYYIANPPYNCHEVDYIRENKSLLNKTFNKVGANNMYSLFLSAMIDVAKEGALIGVIISDSFLTAKAHNGLRRQILSNCSIHQLILCPSSLFTNQKADVRTCIIILQKGKSFQKQVKIANRSHSVADLKSLLKSDNFKYINLNELILSNKNNEIQFIVDVPAEVLLLFKNVRIADKYKCITGISTGNDKKYLSKEKKKGYTIPFYKNPGTRRFYTSPDAYIIDHYMEESLIVSDFMVRNKQFMLKEGITCSSMGLPFSACYLPKGATFGVNANIFPPQNDIFWLLSYLNSHLITYIVRGILIRSNMVTSGYISQIPLLNFSEKEKTELESIAKNVINGCLPINKAIKAINTIVNNSAKLSPNTIETIEKFSINILKSV